MSHVAIVYHSGYGHTRALAESVARGVAEAGHTPELLAIDGLTADFSAIVERATAADAIIFGSPTYMGSYSAPFKAFIDATAGVWYGQKWKNKLAAAFTVSNSFSGDKLNTLNSLAVFAAQHGMLWVPTGELPGVHSQSDASPETINRLGSFLGVMAQADNAAAETTPPSGDHAFAAALGARVAGLAAQFRAGAPANDGVPAYLPEVA